MKTIIIGRFGGSWKDNKAVAYDCAKATVIPSPQKSLYLVELTKGPFVTARFFAASAAAHKKLKQFVDAEGNERIIAPGCEVLCVHIHHEPKGWPEERLGKISIRQAPSYHLEEPSGAVPSTSTRQFPIPSEPGIDSIDARLAGMRHFTPYSIVDQIKVLEHTVYVNCTKPNGSVETIRVETASQLLARRLAASLIKQTPRRLMINQQVTGISALMADHKNPTSGKLTDATLPLAETIIAKSRKG